VVDQITGAEGVDAAVPLIQAISLASPGDGSDDVSVTVLGLDCGVEALFGEFGCDPSALSGLTVPFISPSLKAELGAGGELRTNLGRVALDDAFEIEQLEAFNEGHALAYAMPEAQRQLGRARGVDVVYVLLEDGASVGAVRTELEATLGDRYAVLDALDPPPIIGVVLASFLPLLTMIALLTLGIGAVLVRNSITLSLEERRRQTAIVGALGGSRRTLIGGTLAEMTLLGLAGGALGTLGGIAIAGPVAGGLAQFAQRVAGIPIDLHPTPQAAFVAVGVGVSVACLASIGPARRSVRIDVAGELAGRGRRDEAASITAWWRVLAATAASGFGIWLCYTAQRDGGIEPWQSRLAPLGFLVAMAPLVYVVATATPLLLGLVERRAQWKRASTRMAFANLRREPRRTGVMAVAIGFAVSVGFVTAGFNVSINKAVGDSLSENLAGIEVSSTDASNNVSNEARLSPQLLKELAHLPGVDHIDRGTVVPVGNRSGELIGVSAYTDPWLDGDAAVGELDRDRLKAGEVVIGPGLARSEGLRPGDLLELDTLKGVVELPVMAVILDGDFGGRTVMMDFGLLERLYGPQAPFQVLVVPNPGVSMDEVAATVRAAQLDPGLEVRTLPQVLARIQRNVSEQLSSFDAIQRGLLAMSFVAVLSTLLLAGVQRKREFGMLAAVGMTPAELRRMVITEAGLIAVGGTFLAAFVSIAMLIAMLLITPVVIGYSQPLVLDFAPLLRYGAIGIAVALVAAIYPARRAARVEVLEALRYE
jgi:putative ABC transport system permease protein